MSDPKTSQLHIATSSERKSDLYRAVLSAAGIPVIYRHLETDLKLDRLDEQHIDLHVLAQKKLDHALKEVKQYPFFVEQSGLAIEVWNGLPGGLSDVFFGQNLGCAVVCQMLSAFGSEVRATVQTIIHYVVARNKVWTREHEFSGLIASSPRGDGWGWERIFIPDGTTSTLGELTHADKCRLLATNGPAVVLKEYWESQHAAADSASKSPGIHIVGDGNILQFATGTGNALAADRSSSETKTGKT